MGWNTIMADLSKLSRLLDDPEVRVVVFGLAHVCPALTSAESGASRLRAAVLHLADTTDPKQYRGWLSDDAPNNPITVEQVRAALGDDVINDLSTYAESSPDHIAWQLKTILPDLVDAVSPGGYVVEASELGRELRDASAAGDHSAGPFAPHVH